jgi:hypothetical protein
VLQLATRAPPPLGRHRVVAVASPKSSVRSSCLRMLEHYNYLAELMVAFFPSFSTPTPRNTAAIATRMPASLSSPSPHPSTASPPALTPSSAPPHPRVASQPFPIHARTPERRRAVLPGRRLCLAVGRPTRTSPTPPKTSRRSSSTPSCFSPSSSPPPATSFAGIDGQISFPCSDSGQGPHCKPLNSSRVLSAKFQSFFMDLKPDLWKIIGMCRKIRKIPNLLG